MTHITETFHDLVEAEARHDYDPEPDPDRPTRKEARADTDLTTFPLKRSGVVIDGYEMVSADCELDGEDAEVF